MPPHNLWQMQQIQAMISNFELTTKSNFKLFWDTYILPFLEAQYIVDLFFLLLHA
jgi:hypothetical protein